MKMHYTAYSLLTYDNMDSCQTTMIWTDVGEQTMDDGSSRCRGI